MPAHNENRYRLVLPAAVGFALLLTTLVYLPGLGSGMYLDDFYNLQLLARVKEQGMLAFVGSGASGPFGRPLSYLSFAVQAGSWPGNLAAFKLVNLLLHLGNGILIFFLCRAIAPRIDLPQSSRDLFCIFSTGLWLLHPMHLSTVLYIVQRMTELSATFVFLGLLGYLTGRRLAQGGRLRPGYGVMTLAVGGGTLLAALCKENGILLPLLVLVLDWTLFDQTRSPPGYRRWRLVCLVLPAVAVGAWLLWQAWAFQHTFDLRPYSMYQKFLTEAPVLMTYLWNLLVPRPSAYGLFHDDFPVATGLLDPIWTLPALIAVAVLIGAAVHARRRLPLLAFGLLWFFAGHLLESTHLNLEIYFEHRNYLPSMGLLTLIPWALLRQGPEARAPTGAVAALCLYLGLTTWVSAQNSLLWRQPVPFAQEMVRIHPDSRWALAQLGSHYIGVGDVERAAALYRDMAARYPTAILPWLRLASISGCLRNAPVPAPVWAKLELLAAEGESAGFDVIAELDTQVSVLAQRGCTGLDPARLARVVDGMAGNPRLARERPAMYQLAGTLHLLRGDVTGALQRARLAHQASPNLARHWYYIDLLLTLGHAAEAREEIAQFKAALDRKPVAWLAYRDKLAAAGSRLDAVRNKIHKSN
jgi:tetratricopeptide (TPR) repeat protein